MSRVIPIAVAGTAADATSGLPAPPPLSLYVHVPWCVRKCPYCDFNSHEAKGSIPEEAYGAALIADLESYAKLLRKTNRPQEAAKLEARAQMIRAAQSQAR